MTGTGHVAQRTVLRAAALTGPAIRDRSQSVTEHRRQDNAPLA
jgi:hypothetical protein